MWSNAYSHMGVPIRLHLEFSQMTIGELSGVLATWQALLRAAWRESNELSLGRTGPQARMVVEATSAANSFDMVSDIAVNLTTATALVGPVRDWPALARASYRYLGSVWREQERREPSLASGHALYAQDEVDMAGALYMRGGRVPELIVGTDSLAQRGVAEQVVRLWELANRGGITLTVDDSDVGLRPR